MKSLWWLLLACCGVALAQPLLLDPGFPNGNGPDDYVRSVVVQPDGRILIAGEFTNVHGVYRPGLARLLTDGGLDPSFAPDVTHAVRQVRLAPDGSVLLSGYSTNQTATLPGVAKLRPDGAFDPAFALPSYRPTNASLGGLYPSVAGRLWLAGTFTNVSQLPARRLVRLNADGSLDPTFVSPFRASDSLGYVVPLADGAVLVAGGFTNLGGVTGYGLARLQPDGSVDPSFRSPLGPTNSVSRLTLLGDGSVLALWTGSLYGEYLPKRLVRLRPNGDLDPDFQPTFQFPAGLTSSGLVSLCAQPDGGVVVFGYFRAVNGVPRPGLARLQPDGSTDLCYDPGLGLSTFVLSADTAADGSVVIGGTFLDVECQPRPYLARLQTPAPCQEPAILEFGADGVRVSEDGRRALLSVTRTGGADRELSVGFETESGTATPGADYVPATGTLTFGAGMRSVSLSIPVIPDAEVELEERFAVRLRDPGPSAVVGPRSLAEVTIVDHVPGGQAGQPDPAFRPPVAWPVTALAGIDGEMFLAAMGGWAGTGSTGVVERWGMDGSPDPAFTAIRCNDPVVVLVRMGDGDWLAGGTFREVNGFPRYGLARFGDAGAVDDQFNPFAILLDPAGTGGSISVESLLPLSDGSVLVGGSFRFPGETMPRPIARITADGELDTSFAAGFRPGIGGVALTAWPAGGYLVGVSDLNFGVLHLFANGVGDPRFVPSVNLPGYASSLATEPYGSLLAGGIIGGPWPDDIAPALVRLNVDGSLAANLGPSAGLRTDYTYVPPVRVLLALPDGKILVGGAFTEIGGLPGRVVARLHSDGSMDHSFDTGAVRNRLEIDTSWTNVIPAEVRAVIPLPGGGWLVGGEFAGFGDLDQPFLVRLEPEQSGHTPAVQLLLTTNQIAEGAGFLSGRVLRRGDASQPVSVRLLAEGLDASPGVEFEPLDLELEFAAGEWVKDFDVRLIDDTVVGLSFAFQLVLTNPSAGLTLVEPASQIVVILEDDVNVEFSGTEFPASEDLGSATVAVVRYGVPGEALTVACRAGDWEGTTTFAAMPSGGTRTNTLVVPVPDDAVAQGEWRQTLTLEVLSPGAALGPRRQASLIVADNDYSLAPAQGVAGVVNALIPAPDGGVYLGGDFTGIHGVPRRSVARLRPDGTVDPGFDPGAGPDAPVTVMAVQPDDRLLVAGYFSDFAGKVRRGVARLNADGSLDTSFDVGVGPTRAEDIREPLQVLALAVQPDGKILVGGSFEQFNHEPAGCLVRLESNGRFDPTFQAPFVSPTGFGQWPPNRNQPSTVRALLLGAEGSSLVAGSLYLSPTQLGSRSLVRLLAGGAVDTSFTPWGPTGAGPSAGYALAFEAGGNLLVGAAVLGTFPLSGTTNWLGLHRLDTNGLPDPTFQLRGFPEIRVSESVVRQVHAQADGSCLVLADYSQTISGKRVRFSRVGRVLADGAWDTAFWPIEATNAIVTLWPGAAPGDSLSYPGAIRAVLPCPDWLTVAGAFNEISGEPRRRLARFGWEGDLWGRFELTAQRNGSWLEVRLPADVPWPYALEASPDLVNWFPIGMTRTPWLPHATGLPATATHLYLRAVQFP